MDHKKQSQFWNFLHSWESLENGQQLNLQVLGQNYFNFYSPKSTTTKPLIIIKKNCRKKWK